MLNKNCIKLISNTWNFFLLMKPHVVTLEKKMHLHQNASPSYYHRIITSWVMSLKSEHAQYELTDMQFKFKQ
jgi:hypothetical protein